MPLGFGLMVTLAGAALPARADWADQQRGGRWQQQEAEALAALSRSDLNRYFEGRRQLERRRADQRQAQLRQLQECLERSRRQLAGVQSCLGQARVQRRQDHQQWQAQISTLRERYQLPGMGERRRSPQPPLGRPASSALPQSWQPGWRPQPQPAATVPYGWY